MALSRVDLPEPFEPTMPTDSPSRTSNDTPLTAWTTRRPRAFSFGEPLTQRGATLGEEFVLDVHIVDADRQRSVVP